MWALIALIMSIFIFMGIGFYLESKVEVTHRENECENCGAFYEETSHGEEDFTGTCPYCNTEY